MKRVLTFAFVLALASPVVAEQHDEAPSLMERGAQQFLEGLLREMEPALDDMRAFMDQMGPAMMDLLETVEDWSRYEPPEVLENGDIIIRRKPDVEPEPERNKTDDLPPQIEL